MGRWGQNSAHAELGRSGRTIDGSQLRVRGVVAWPGAVWLPARSADASAEGQRVRREGDRLGARGGQAAAVVLPAEHFVAHPH